MRLNLVPRACRFVLILGYALLFTGLGLLGYRFPVLTLFACVATVARRRRRRVAGDSHGTARLGDYWDALCGGLLGSSGLILGRASFLAGPRPAAAIRSLLDPRVPSRAACQLVGAVQRGRRGSAELIRLRSFVHLATFAPAGKGKSTCLLLPNLLSYGGNVVVTDPKGELFKGTGAHRQRRLGHKIVRFDPHKIGGEGSACYNPLDAIDEHSPEFFDDSMSLAKLVVFRVGTEPDPHWNESAERYICAFIMFVCACETDRSRRNLLTVWALISSRDNFVKAVKFMQATPGFGGLLARLGGSLTWAAEEELNSIMGTVMRHLFWLNSPNVADHLSRSTFDPRQLRSKERVTLYLCLPHHLLATLAPLQRLWIGSILRDATRGRVDERDPLLFLIDEAAHLGRCEALEDAVTLMRGMGVRLWFFFQSLGQVQHCYGERAHTFLDNMDTQIYFGTNSFETADAISKRIGERTITVTSSDRSSSYSRPLRSPLGEQKDGGNFSSSSSSSSSPQGRELFKASEVLCLPDSTALIFHRNLPVIASRLVYHYADPEFRRGRSGGAAGLGFGLLARAVCLLLAGTLLAVGGLASLVHPDFAPTINGPQWPGLGSWYPPDPIERDRRVAIQTAARKATEKTTLADQLRMRRRPVPRHLSNRAIDLEFRRSVATAEEAATRARAALQMASGVH